MEAYFDITEADLAHYVGGLLLEPSGNEFVPGWFFTKRLVPNDLLAAGFMRESDSILSIFTLAALQDTGWYEVTIPAIDESGLLWGKSQGLNFLTKNCLDSGTANFPEFCDTFDTTTRCDYEHLNKGLCSISRYTDFIPYEFQYFLDPLLGGTDPSMDFCPYVINLSTGGDCRDEELQDEANAHYGEKFGDTSRCINGNFIAQSLTDTLSITAP